MVELTSTFREWHDLRSNDRLGQGDILRNVGGDADPWRQWLIVITADCDLANAKYGGALSCVSVLNHTDYLNNFRLPKVMEQLGDALIKDIVQTLRSAPYGMEGAESRPQVTEARLRIWIVMTEMAAVGKALQLSGKHYGAVERSIEAFRQLKDAEKSDDISLRIRAVAEARVVLGEGKTVEKAKQSVVKDLSSSLSRLPGDAMFINSLASDASDGYVAYLRRIHEVNDGNVSTSTKVRSTDFVRVGRLMAPYIYALTQQVGSVFSSIGLPTEYERNRSQAADLFTLFQLEDAQ